MQIPKIPTHRFHSLPNVCSAVTPIIKFLQVVKGRKEGSNQAHPVSIDVLCSVLASSHPPSPCSVAWSLPFSVCSGSLLPNCPSYFAVWDGITLPWAFWGLIIFSSCLNLNLIFLEKPGPWEFCRHGTWIFCWSEHLSLRWNAAHRLCAPGRKRLHHGDAMLDAVEYTPYPLLE